MLPWNFSEELAAYTHGQLQHNMCVPASRRRRPFDITEVGRWLKIKLQPTDLSHLC